MRSPFAFAPWRFESVNAEAKEWISLAKGAFQASTGLQKIAKGHQPPEQWALLLTGVPFSAQPTGGGRCS